MICLMVVKSYSDEFRRQAVDLYESTAGATFTSIAADLGVTRDALARWVRVLGSGTTTPAGSTSAGSPGRQAGTSPAAGPGSGLGRGESPAALIARLQARVAELEAETSKLSTEREILRSAAKYFAGETNW